MSRQDTSGLALSGRESGLVVQLANRSGDSAPMLRGLHGGSRSEQGEIE